jgi:MYXO-CTERM domain-containing protein
MVFLLKFLIPDVATGQGISNPAFVIPFWALLLLGLFWRWRWERKMAGA